MSDLLTRGMESLLAGEFDLGAPVRSTEEELLGLHDVFRERLLRHAVSLGLKLHDAEDVVQEVFLALFRHLEAGRPRNNLPGWIFRVTHRMALKCRVQYRPADCAADGAQNEMEAMDVCSPEEQVILNEQLRRLQRIFVALPEIDRLCLQLRSEGLRYREIAGVLNISLGLVHKSLSRSLDRMS